MHSDDDINTRVTGLKDLHRAAVGEDCLVIIHSAQTGELGRRYVLDKAQLNIGRSQDNDIVIVSDAVSRRHALLERRGREFHVIDLNSTNGTFTNDDAKPVKERRLERGDQLRIGDTVFKYLAGSDIEAQYHAVLGHMAVTDGLTNLANRKQLDRFLTEEVQRARRHGRELCVLMLDVDHFKRINDEYGHLAGDAVLARIATLLGKRLRPNDRLGRYGGEEFCAILPETGLSDALQIADALRALVATQVFSADGYVLSVTLSAGVACLAADMKPEDGYRAADQKLYEAKQQGRNRVCG